MSTLLRPVCSSPATGGYAVGDTIVFVCSSCGGYRLAGTALTLLQKGTLMKPDAGEFRELVRVKRGDSSEYPIIKSGDLGG